MSEMKFLQNLEDLLEMHDMKRSELAKIIGITQPTITAWYTKGCENVSLSTLRKICNLFHITLDELIYGKIENEMLVKFNYSYYSEEEIQVIKTLFNYIHSKERNHK